MVKPFGSPVHLLLLSIADRNTFLYLFLIFALSRCLNSSFELAHDIKMFQKAVSTNFCIDYDFHRQIFFFKANLLGFYQTFHL